MKWYIHSERPENDNCWTITNLQNVPGWETDGGYEGYGLPKEIAQIIIRYLNNHDEDFHLRPSGCLTNWLPILEDEDD